MEDVVSLHDPVRVTVSGERGFRRIRCAVEEFSGGLVVVQQNPGTFPLPPGIPGGEIRCQPGALDPGVQVKFIGQPVHADYVEPGKVE